MEELVTFEMLCVIFHKKKNAIINCGMALYKARQKIKTEATAAPAFNRMIHQELHGPNESQRTGGIKTSLYKRDGSRTTDRSTIWLSPKITCVLDFIVVPG